ncbi:MAG: DUF6503 family protein [Rhodothermales bacterium]
MSEVLRFLSIILCLVLIGCTPESSTPGNTSAEATPALADSSAFDILDSGLHAHGGLETWQSYGSLEYDVDRGGKVEHHLIDLKNRKSLQIGDTYSFGFDGKDAWVAPGLDAFSGNARFYNGLDFYFFGIPFLLADPGTKRDLLGRVMIDGDEYDAVKVSFDAGIGGSPDDYYIAHFDTDTGLMRVLLYTATFRSQKPSENYNGRIYEEWQEVGGLMVPAKITSAPWDNETRRLGKAGRETVYKNVQFLNEQPDAVKFTRPDTSEVEE